MRILKTKQNFEIVLQCLCSVAAWLNTNVLSTCENNCVFVPDGPGALCVERKQRCNGCWSVIEDFNKIMALISEFSFKFRLIGRVLLIVVMSFYYGKHLFINQTKKNTVGFLISSVTDTYTSDAPPTILWCSHCILDFAVHSSLPVWVFNSLLNLLIMFSFDLSSQEAEVMDLPHELTQP